MHKKNLKELIGEVAFEDEKILLEEHFKDEEDEE